MSAVADGTYRQGNEPAFAYARSCIAAGHATRGFPSVDPGDRSDRILLRKILKLRSDRRKANYSNGSHSKIE